MKHAPGRADYVDVYRQILDHPLLDADDWECGTVDDVEVEGDIGQPLRITALLVGPGAWAPRLPAWAGRLAPHLFGDHCTRVPWSEVSSVGEYIRLRSRAAALGLGTIERRLGLRIARMPGGEKGER